MTTDYHASSRAVLITITDDITDPKHTETRCDRNCEKDSPGDDNNLILRKIRLIVLFQKINMIESCREPKKGYLL